MTVCRCVSGSRTFRYIVVLPSSASSNFLVCFTLKDDDATNLRYIMDYTLNYTMSHSRRIKPSGTTNHRKLEALRKSVSYILQGTFKNIQLQTLRCQYNVSVNNTTLYFIYNKNSTLSGRHVSTFIRSSSGPLRKQIQELSIFQCIVGSQMRTDYIT